MVYIQQVAVASTALVPANEELITVRSKLDASELNHACTTDVRNTSMRECVSEIEGVCYWIEYPDATSVVAFFHIEAVCFDSHQNHAVVYFYGVLVDLE